MSSTRPGSRRLFVSNSQDSVRMFAPNWMEALSKIHWSAVPIVFLPAIGWLLLRGLGHGSAGFVLTHFFLGVVSWTLMEYLLHRFVFHFEPEVAWGKRLHFIFHGVHHDYPSDRLRLVMPPSASVPIALAFYGLFALLLPADRVDAVVAGLLLGYVVYDLTHYALHHATFQAPWLKALKRLHMQHHFVDPDRGYGVTSPIWDWVLGTRSLPAPQAKAAARTA